MARDELVHELERLRAATSADDVEAHFAAIHAGECTAVVSMYALVCTHTRACCCWR